MTQKSESDNIAVENNTRIDLYKLAIDAGMTTDDFIKQVRKEYAAYLSILLDENPGKVFLHITSYIDHDVEIAAKRINIKNASIN